MTERYGVPAMSDLPEQTPPASPMLASDAERDDVVLHLREAVGEGRLTLEEFSDRVDLVHASRTHGELEVITRDLPALVGPSVPAPAAQQHRAVCSHLVRQGPWALPASSSWRSVFGTIDLDLRQARLSGNETTMAIYNLFGTVTVIVPRGVEVVISGGGLFASQKVESPEHAPGPGAPRLLIECHGPGGTLHVRSQPWRRSALKA
jgi:Domain of unknown function (DUF1707)/Cell wall-active antibiotics response 4TMS YvqF